MRAGLVIVGLLGSAPVFAADADPFSPSSGLPIGQGTLQGEPTAVGESGFHGGIYAFTANDLAVFQSAEEGPYEGAVIPEDRLLGQILGTTVHGGWTFGSRVRIDGFVPFYPYVEASSFQGIGFGDARIQATLGVKNDGPVRFSVIPKLELPTGLKKAYLARGTTGTVTAALGGPIVEDRLEWLTNVGLAMSPSDVVRDRGLGSSLDLLGGVVVHPTDTFRVGVEYTESIGLAKAGAIRANTRGDAGLFAQAIHPSGLALSGAGSVGVGGIGAPDYRVFAGLTYGPVNPDRDHDGIHDRDDGCPLDPEDLDGFEDADGCPDLDNDKDGVADLVDVCRDEPEDPDGFGDGDGCPDPDNDHDYVLDADDKCRDVPGEKAFAGCPDTDADGLQDSEDTCPTEFGPKETGGCPDKDKDLVPDSRDLCPTEPRPADEDPAISDGCPKSVYITGKQIRILDKVFFETNKTVIKKESFGLLDKVAAVFKKSPWIEKVEVGGHTDDKGNDAANLKLSQGRADSVKKYLEKAGVEPARLVAKGYGEGVPVDTNRTEAGRANNRRVEFQILQQSPPPVAVPRPPATPDGGALQPAPKPSDAKPADAKPAEKPATPPKPVEPAPKPADAKPADVPPKPADVAPKPAEPLKPAAEPAKPGASGMPPVPVIPSAKPGTAPAAKPAESKPAPSATDGRLTVKVSGASFADVYVDDVKLPKTAPFEGLALSAGEHVITVVNTRSALMYEERVVVKAGEDVVINAK